MDGLGEGDLDVSDRHGPGGCWLTLRASRGQILGMAPRGVGCSWLSFLPSSPLEELCP